MRRNLTLLVAASTAAVVLALVVPLGLLVGRLAQDRAVAAATQQAQSVALLVATGTPVGQLADVIALSDQRTGLHTSVVPPTGSPIGPTVPAGDLTRARGGEAFTQVPSVGEASVLLPIAASGGTSVVRVAVSRAALSQGVTRARILLIALGAGLVAAALAAAVLLARRVSAPLVNVADVAHDLRSGRLDRRVVVEGPTEVREVGTALNQLAGRIGELLQAERESAADLSHRLRTPVTALRLAVDTTGDPSERARLREHLDRLEATVDTVVRQSRRPASDTADGQSEPIDLSELVAERVTFWSALAEDQGRVVRRSIQPGVNVLADSADLTDLLDVLLDNVFAHTDAPAGFGVSVSGGSGADAGAGAGAHGRWATLVVEDEGPGLPASDRLGRGRSSAGSTGLGLDIVARIADATGGEVILGAGDDGGARVTVHWPGSA